MSSFSCSFFSKQCLQNFTTTYIKRIKSTSTIHIHIFEILTPCTVTNPPKIPAPIPAAFLASKRHLSGMPFAHYLSLLPLKPHGLSANLVAIVILSRISPRAHSAISSRARAAVVPRNYARDARNMGPGRKCEFLAASRKLRSCSREADDVVVSLRAPIRPRIDNNRISLLSFSRERECVPFFFTSCSPRANVDFRIFH